MTLALVGARSGSEVARSDLGTAAVLLAVAGWIVFLLAYDRWGREHGRRRRRRGAPPAAVELPEDPPAIAHALHEGGNAGTGLLGVILVELARRGYLDIVEGHRVDPMAEPVPDWEFRRRETPGGDLRPYENALYTRVFAAGNEVTVGAVLAWAEQNRQQARVFLERLRKYVAADLREEGYLVQTGRLPVALNLGASAVVILVGLGALAIGAFVGLVAIASGALQASRTRVLRRQTMTGSERAQKWVEVGHALEHVDTLGEPPAETPDEWERCLVYAVALGVTRGFVSALEEREPKLFNRDDFASWYQSDPEKPRLAGIAPLTESFGRWFADAAEGPVRVTAVQGGVLEAW